MQPINQHALLSSHQHLNQQGSDLQNDVYSVEYQMHDGQTSTHQLNSIHQPYHEQRPVYLGGLFLAANLVTLLFTIIPVVINFPSITSDNPGWYAGDDIIRLLEPIISMPLQFFILLESAIFIKHLDKNNRIAIIVFMIAAAVYQQGAGFHSAAVMFKHSVQTAIEDPAATPILPLLTDIKSWIRDLWEHTIAHYMYAIGGIIISFVNAYVFRNYTVPLSTRITKKYRLVWILNSIVYGLIVGSVAIQFPKGPIVALCLVLIYGYLILGTYTYRHKRLSLSTLGEFPVLQSYLASYTLALVIIIIWVAKMHGFVGRNELK
ncbi:hypothetical protein BDV3_000515 [Batrachochytrium dendrobatidis]